MSWLEKVSPIVTGDTTESMGDMGEERMCRSVRSQGTRGPWKSIFIAKRRQLALPCALLVPQP